MKCDADDIVAQTNYYVVIQNRVHVLVCILPLWHDVLCMFEGKGPFAF